MRTRRSIRHALDSGRAGRKLHLDGQQCVRRRSERISWYEQIHNQPQLPEQGRILIHCRDDLVKVELFLNVVRLWQWDLIVTKPFRGALCITRSEERRVGKECGSRRAAGV